MIYLKAFLVVLVYCTFWQAFGDFTDWSRNGIHQISKSPFYLLLHLLRFFSSNLKVFAAWEEFRKRKYNASKIECTVFSFILFNLHFMWCHIRNTKSFVLGDIKRMVTNTGFVFCSWYYLHGHHCYKTLFIKDSNNNKMRLILFLFSNTKSDKIHKTH